jgi:DNA-binding transcriptional LysR family regulator
MDLNRVGVFVRVVESGSFTAAARSLALPTSSVSRAVARLEEELGVRLLQRTTRSLNLTDAGRQYHDGVRGALGALEDAAAMASEASREPHGTVRVTAPADFATPFFMDIVARFLGRFPRVNVDAYLTNRRVHLVEEGIDLAIRAGTLDDSSLVARRVAQSRMCLYAAPAYVERRGRPRTVAQLARHDCVLFRASTGIVPWRLTGPRGVEEITVSGRITVDAMTAAREAVAAGLGIGLIPEMGLPGSLGSQGLVRVLPRHALEGAALHVVWPSSRFLPRPVALFRDHLVAELAGVIR